MKRLRLLTFNIAHGRGLVLHQSLRREVKIRAQLLKIGRLIARLDADIVALQEVDEDSHWSGSFDHLACLAGHAGLPHVAFGITNRRVGRYHLNYGNAVLSRFPVVRSERFDLPFNAVDEKRCLLFAELEAPLRQVVVSAEGIRLGQFLKLAELVDTGSEGKELLLAGEVEVNGEVETRRGRQMMTGDVVRAKDHAVEVAPPPG